MRTLRSDIDSNRLILRFDGGSRGNPGPSAFCYIVMDEDERMICIHSEYIGISTNNYSEYMGFLKGLEYLTGTFDVSKYELKVETDSELVVKQLKGEYAIRNPRLKEISEKIRELLTRFRKFNLKHIPRVENSADSFVRMILKKRKKEKYAEGDS